MSPSGERKLVSVLFADLVGSTALGDVEDPERTRLLLEHFYEAMRDEIEAVGGTVEKFIGDAVMAAFGAPAAQEDHAERSLHAALGMRRRLREVFDERLSLRIGVNTGEVVFGLAREKSSFVSGDAVNVAARLEQAAEPGEVLVGERTAAAARGAFEFGEAMTVEAKGKPGGVPCRRLVGALSLARPRGVAGVGRAFVGRDAEGDALRRVYRGVVDERAPHLVSLIGEAGAGKTRLAREFWRWLGAQTPEPVRRSGNCRPYGQDVTYGPLGEVLKEHFGLLEGEPPEALLRRLGSREILGLAFGLDVAHGIHPRAARDRMREACIGLLGELVAERPAVLLFEELHWAEDDLLDLLEVVLGNVPGPLLLLCTARPELLGRRPGWGGARRAASTLELEPLSGDDTRRMLAEMLGPEPAERLSALAERAEGNPFFVEELLSDLIDRGIVAREHDGWRVGALPTGPGAPDTIQTVVAARIDLLPPAEKAALQAASVIGRVFWCGPIYELLPEADPDFDVLEDRNFIHRHAVSAIAGETQCAFKHQITREVAYGTLPKSKRARLHADFAAWLERFSEGRDEYASLLAHHYAEAVRPENADLVWAGESGAQERLRARAVRWLARAAELATAQYAVDEAIGLLDRALELEADEQALADLWRRRAHASALAYDGEGFYPAMHEAIELTSDQRALADLYSELALETALRQGMWIRSPDPAEIEGTIRRALGATQNEQSPARARALIAAAAWDPAHGGEAARDASALADRLGKAELRSQALGTVVKTAIVHGHARDALAAARRRLGLREVVSDPEDRALMHWDVAVASLAAGQVRAAETHARLHAETVRGLSPHHKLHGVGLLLMVAELTGQWEAIRGLREHAERTASENIGTPCTFNARSLLCCALASAHAGEEDEARRLEHAADAVGVPGFGLTIDAPRLRLALVRGDLPTAERLAAAPREEMWFAAFDAQAARLDAQAALRDRRRLEEEAPPLLGAGNYLEPFALRALGLIREDTRLLSRAVERFAALGLDWHAEHTRALLAVSS